MARIILQTRIEAPAQRVFDLARSIDAHKASAGKSGERAVAGTTEGLIGLNETVTWSARHFGVRQRLSIRITAMDAPRSFTDEMERGAFAWMRHTHTFEPLPGSPAATLMHDDFAYAAPLGPLGRLVDRLVLERHMRKFLLQRNAVLKELVESDRWHRFVSGP